MIRIEPVAIPNDISRRSFSVLASFFFTLFITLTAIASATSETQHAPDANPFAQVPFERWVEQGPVAQIPFEAHTAYVGLSSHQRQLVRVASEVRIKELSRRPSSGQLLLFIQITDPSGTAFRNYGLLSRSDIHSQSKNDTVEFSWKAFVLPGQYRVTLAVYHSVTGEHSLQVRTMSVPPVQGDPLPHAWQDLPSVEFFAPTGEADLDFIFRPEIVGRLQLPLATRQPVQLEVLADFTTSDLFSGSRTLYLRYVSAVLPVMKTLAQIKVGNGSIDIATLDLTQRQVSFNQQIADEIDWPRLKQVFSGIDPGKVSVKTLDIRKPTPGFLREEIVRRVAAGQGSPEKPLKVFIVVTSPLGTYSFNGLSDGPLMPECNCVVYYLQIETQYRQIFFEAEGNVRKMFRPWKVRTFTSRNTLEFRRALASILEEVAKM